MNPDNQPRVFDVFHDSGYNQLLRKVRELTEDAYNASGVFLLGGKDDRDVFVLAFAKAIGKENLAKKLVGRLACEEDRDDGTPFSLASERNTQELIEMIHDSEKDKTQFPFKTVVLLYPTEESEQFLPSLIKRCRNVNVYEVHSYHPDQEPGIIPRAMSIDYCVKLKSQPLTEIRSEAIDWLYKGYLPRGMVVTLFAPKGRGKTKICDYFTSVVTTGRAWADGTPNALGPHRVLRFNLEDPIKQVLKPALQAAGADLSLVEYVEPVAEVSADGMEGTTSLNLSDESHVMAFKQKIADTGAALAIVEPLNNYKGKAKSISEDDMRPIYMALSAVAKETGACVLVINHANKKKDVDVLEKSLGAGSGPAVARVNWFLEKNPDNPEERVLTDAGSNLPTGPSLVFTIVQPEPFELDGVMHRDVGYAKFLRTDAITGDELLERVQYTKKGEMERIAVWLKEFLSGKDEVNVNDVRLAAQNENPEWSWELIKLTNSRKKISKSRNEGGGKSKRTFWSLPTAEELRRAEQGTQEQVF